jgi:transcriptional regulator NrdR family protein
MTIYKIRKRNGSIETFEKGKIFTAIKAAFDAVGQTIEEKEITKLVNQVLTEVEKTI